MTSITPHSLVLLCPSCAKLMRHVRIIPREGAQPLHVLECMPCGVTLSQALDEEQWTGKN